MCLAHVLHSKSSRHIETEVPTNFKPGFWRKKMSTTTWILALAVAALGAMGTTGCVKIEDSGELPKVEVTPGEMPRVEVRKPEMEVESEERKITLPNVDIDFQDTDVPVPDISVDTDGDE